MTAHDAAARAVKEVEQRMSDLSLLIKHTTTYRQLKPIYDEYRKSPDKEKYLRGHESEIILFEAAARALKEMQIKKLPDLAALRKEYRSLNDRKTKLYEDYRQAKKQMQEYGVVKKNVDSILYPSQSRARSRSLAVLSPISSADVLNYQHRQIKASTYYFVCTQPVSYTHLDVYKRQT